MAGDDVPEDAPEACPGTGSDQAGKSDACAGCPNQVLPRAHAHTHPQTGMRNQYAPSILVHDVASFVYSHIPSSPAPPPACSFPRSLPLQRCTCVSHAHARPPRTPAQTRQKICASGEAAIPDPAIAVIAERLSNVKHKILVLSGKGGVGKSTFSAQVQGKNTHTHTHMHTHTHTRTHSHTHTHRNTHTCTRKCTRAHLHTRTHLHTHAHTQTHTRAYVPTHTPRKKNAPYSWAVGVAWCVCARVCMYACACARTCVCA